LGTPVEPLVNMTVANAVERPAAAFRNAVSAQAGAYGREEREGPRRERPSAPA